MDTADAPTDSMMAFFDERTKRHIALVERNIVRLSTTFEAEHVAGQLDDRAAAHDASKWSAEEHIGYVHLTEAHRAGGSGAPLRYPNAAVHEAVRKAVARHKAVNRHHPEFHKSTDDMTLTDVAEMVADWAAVAQEMAEDMLCSPRAYFEGTAKAKYGFSAATNKRIESLIVALERVLAEERSRK